MDYRTLGESVLNVSCLALGGNIFGRFCDRRETAAIITAAGDLGVNFIDTADVYSDGLSEEYIGATTRNCRGQWIIASKVGVRSGEHPGKKGRRENILSRVEESLGRLKTDYIDLYQMHHYDSETPLDETLGVLDELIRQGKIRCVGVSNYSGKQLRRAWHTAQELHVSVFSSMQNHYNMFKREAETDVFPVCREVHVGVMIYGALARGVLSGKYRYGQRLPAGSRGAVSASIRDDLTESILETVRALADFAEHRGKTVGMLALAWVLQRSEVSAVVVGIRNPEQLKANLGAVGWKLSKSDLAEINAIVGDLDKYCLLSLGSSAAQPIGRLSVGHD